MGCSLSLCLSQKMSLKLYGGITCQTVFPKTETKLDSLEYQEALGHAVRSIDASKYQSVMDLLLCLSFPYFKPSAMAFYRGKGPPLREMVPDSLLEAYDTVLSDTVLENRSTNSRLGWYSIKKKLGNNHG